MTPAVRTTNQPTVGISPAGRGTIRLASEMKTIAAAIGSRKMTTRRSAAKTGRWTHAFSGARAASIPPSVGAGKRAVK